MSAAAEEKSDDTILCAGCGIAGGDDIILKKCACKLVQYCGVQCQKEHRAKHKKECKKRIAELRDEILFNQPEGNHLGDCPICFLPIPLDETKHVVSQCCSKVTCKGCQYASFKSVGKNWKEAKCAFCRTLQMQSQEEFDRDEVKRAEANDPVALRQQGARCHEKGDHGGALKFWTKAAELGSAEGHLSLAKLYFEGNGVEEDEKKARYHCEKAAIGGHPRARYLLGCMEGGNGNKEKSVKHFIIAAKQGHEEALNRVKKWFLDGIASKEEYSSTLRGYQAAVDATQSAQREEAYEFFRKIESYTGRAL